MALFKRIARTARIAENWQPVALTLVEGSSQVTPSFSIDALELSDTYGTYDRTITDPSLTWFNLGFFHGSVPRFVVGDSLIARVTITSSDSAYEVVFLRHDVPTSGVVKRVRMDLISTSGGPGSYIRVYEKNVRAGIAANVLAARLNAVVDVFSHGTIYSLSAPFANEYWGVPYIVIR